MRNGVNSVGGKMKVKVTGIKEIRRALKKFNKKLREDMLKDVGIDQIKRIRTRASRGEGYKGKFKRYSPSYAKRSGKTSVDLRQTGRMLDNIDVKTTVNKMEISCNVMYAEHVNSMRPFMGFNTSDVNKMVNKMQVNTNKMIRRSGF